MPPLPRVSFPALSSTRGRSSGGVSLTHPTRLEPPPASTTEKRRAPRMPTPWQGAFHEHSHAFAAKAVTGGGLARDPWEGRRRRRRHGPFDPTVNGTIAPPSRTPRPISLARERGTPLAVEVLVTSSNDCASSLACAPPSSDRPTLPFPRSTLKPIGSGGSTRVPFELDYDDYDDDDEEEPPVIPIYFDVTVEAPALPMAERMEKSRGRRRRHGRVRRSRALRRAWRSGS